MMITFYKTSVLGLEVSVEYGVIARPEFELLVCKPREGDSLPISNCKFNFLPAGNGIVIGASGAVVPLRVVPDRWWWYAFCSVD